MRTFCRRFADSPRKCRRINPCTSATSSVRRRQASADRPDRLIGDDECRSRAIAALSLELAADDGERLAGFTLARVSPMQMMAISPPAARLPPWRGPRRRSRHDRRGARNGRRSRRSRRHRRTSGRDVAGMGAARTRWRILRAEATGRAFAEVRRRRISVGRRADQHFGSPCPAVPHRVPDRRRFQRGSRACRSFSSFPRRAALVAWSCGPHSRGAAACLLAGRRAAGHTNSTWARWPAAAAKTSVARQQWARRAPPPAQHRRRHRPSDCSANPKCATIKIVRVPPQRKIRQVVESEAAAFSVDFAVRRVAADHLCRFHIEQMRCMQRLAPGE